MNVEYFIFKGGFYKIVNKHRSKRKINNLIIFGMINSLNGLNCTSFNDLLKSGLLARIKTQKLFLKL